ncbi:MAG: hypothetical protein PHI48_10445 [Bacteroidales bacterium]|nr:hypothetical protein [Bacteroidales bacterium]
MKKILNALLALSVVIMLYLCTMSILGPIQFTEAKGDRDKAVIKRLIDIRTAQVAFLNKKGEYAKTFDTLIYFLKNEKLPFVSKTGSLTDEQLQAGLTEAEAVKQGIIIRDTIFVSAKDTLFGPSFNPDSIRFVPGTTEQFELQATEIPTNAGLWMKVFQCNTPYDVYLKGLNHQEIVNLKDKASQQDRYPGLQVGSVTEVNNNAGNWE